MEVGGFPVLWGHGKEARASRECSEQPGRVLGVKSGVMQSLSLSKPDKLPDRPKGLASEQNERLITLVAVSVKEPTSSGMAISDKSQ
jgi:hypothetical protein